MEELTTIIERATAGIKVGYFLLNIDGGDRVYRERVYCYELYHQMRLCWPKQSDFSLNGEVDKAGHPILRSLKADHAKPDLLVHRPGFMGGNHAVIEVKSSHRVGADAIRKDLETLSLFRSSVGYQRAIYLIYGNRAGATAQRVMNIARQFPALELIELWLHERPGNCANHHADLQGSTESNSQQNLFT